MLEKTIAIADKLLNGIEHASLRIAQAAGILLLCAIAIITVNVFTLAALGHVVLPASELSGYILAASASMVLAYAQVRKAHIRIDAMYNILPPPPRRVLDVLSLTAFLAFLLVMTSAAVGVAQESIARHSLSNTPLQVPLWIPQVIWVAGMVWFCIVLLAILVRTILALIQGDLAAVERLAGNQDEAALLGEEA